MGEKYLKVVSVAEKRDVGIFKSFLHQDFMYVSEFGLLNSDEFVKDIRDSIASGWTLLEPKCLFENESSLVWQHMTDDLVVTHVQLWKDDKLWREMVNRNV